MDQRAFSRVVLLGHTGYIGSRLGAVLERAGVVVNGRSAPSLDLTQPGSASILEGLLDRDTALVVCAAIKKQLGDTPEIFSQNLAIVLNVCRAVSSGRAGRVVFFSSAAVYGEDVRHGTIDEATPVEPTSLYGIGKFTAERLLLRATSQTDTPLLILRPALVYGPGEPGYYYGPSGFLAKALSNEPITLWGDGQEFREFLFVDDVVELVWQLTLSRVTGVLNVVSGTSYTYAQALTAIEQLIGRQPAITSRPRTKDQVDHQFDPARLREVCPGFRFASLEEGLRRVVDRTVPVMGPRA